MTWEKEPRCIAVLEPVERQTAHLVFDSKVMDNLHWILNFNLDTTNEIFNHSWKERLKISKTTKFGCKMNIVA